MDFTLYFIKPAVLCSLPWEKGEGAPRGRTHSPNAERIVSNSDHASNSVYASYGVTPAALEAASTLVATM